MCLEGKCTNRSCKAFGKMVIMNQGHNDFDLINEAYTCKCPLCCEHVVPETCGFIKCMWQATGRKVGKPGQPPERFRTDLKCVGDVYERFSPTMNGMANFLDLKIHCEERVTRNVCMACSYEVCSEGTRRSKCGHTFHDHCFHLATNGDRNCIECTAKLNMTPFQKIFGC